MAKSRWIPVSEATLIARANRERLLRAVQAGSVDGILENGRWLVEEGSLKRYIEKGGFENRRQMFSQEVA